jgi:DNA-directed RNA polymerase specialized sigma24 family protein
MIAFASDSTTTESISWQETFLEMLPMIKRYARRAFRELDAHTKEDAVQDVVAGAYCAYYRLRQRGELQRAFASVLARFAIAQYRAGRRVGTTQCSRDVYSLQARNEAGYELRRIGTPGEQNDGRWGECLTDNRRSRIPELVAFRLDFSQWLDYQTVRDKRLAEQLALGYGTGEVAGRFRISPARVSQLRRELAESWYAFIGESASAAYAVECSRH